MSILRIYSFKLIMCLTLAICLSFCFAGMKSHAGTEADIILTYVPNLGQTGSVRGSVVLPDGMDYGDYAIIAILDTIIYGQYVKPTWANYLTDINGDGSFSVNIYTNASDAQYDLFYLYIVKKSDFDGVNGTSINTGYMIGKYLKFLECRKSDNTPPPVSSVYPGLVPNGTKFSIDVPASQAAKRGVFYYTTDGTDPVTSLTRLICNPGTVFEVNGTVILKAVNVYNARPSELATFTYLVDDGQEKPFRGLNFSPNITESFSYELSEETVRERLEAVAPYTQWIRTFTTTTGLQYANKNAKALGLKTMIGLYLFDDSTFSGRQLNEAQIASLRNILNEPSPPDLICVGNEMSIMGIGGFDATLQKYLKQAREAVLSAGLTIPIGFADIYGYDPSPEVAAFCDYYAYNYYPSVWDRSAPADSVSLLGEYYNISKRANKMIVVSEYGYPDDGSPYYVENGTIYKPAPDKADAVAALNEFLHWQKNNNVLGFYFQSFKQNAKTGPDIERNFGLMGADLKLFPHYADLVEDFQNGVDYTFFAEENSAIISSHLYDAQMICVLFVYATDDQGAAFHYVSVEHGAYKTQRIYDPDPVAGAKVFIYNMVEWKGVEADGNMYIVRILAASGGCNAVSMIVFNITGLPGQPATLITAAYKDGKLASFVSEPLLLNDGEIIYKEVTLGNLGAGDYDAIRVYIWDSPEEMTPMSSVAEFILD